MRWSIIRLIWSREVRDQLRDRRTLFMIFVLPILLYPIIGIGTVQFSAALDQQARTVVVIGSRFLPETPPLLNATRDGFDPRWFDSVAEAERLKVVLPKAEAEADWLDPELRERGIRARVADAVVVIPEDIRAQLERDAAPRLPIYYDSAGERGQITYLRLKEVQEHWKNEIMSGRLARDKKPSTYAEPIRIQPVDIATATEIGGGIWGKLFPFLIVMMSLTGAFYPAVDICAGEKERGTMETLLISPASRAEIVMGKFLTVVLASMTTAILNVVSLAVTGLQMASLVGGAASAGRRSAAAALAPPTLTSAFWMILLLIPLSVFFSAVCLALAVLARSMKEGQYYMTPLYMICLPLIMLTLMPGVELNLFYSLVPITGVSLLLKALITSDYQTAWRYFLPVLVPTVCYGAIALRWAIDQFESESVLFRESERFDPRLWFRHLLRDKDPRPTGGQALFCFALMITLAWFLMQAIATSAAANGGSASTWTMAIGQVGFILAPPLVLAFALTSDPLGTLRLRLPRAKYLAYAVGLALAANPLSHALGPIVESLFPVSKAIARSINEMISGTQSLAATLLLFAVIPAVCEEFAFRGFILSGLESGHKTRTAILMSAILFGFLHVLLSLFQQLFNATLLGLVIGLLAVRSRSIWPGITFHLINNALAIFLGRMAAAPASAGLAGRLFSDPAHATYDVKVVLLGAAAAAVLITRLAREPNDRADAVTDLPVSAPGSA